jgi:transcriptional regulator with XRE-family HTH domain
MPAVDSEKAAFAERLRTALKRAKKSIHTAAQLAHEFNLRYEGEGVTEQACQKWLTGKARPSADKIETLAAITGVTAYWLKNGSPPPKTQKKAAPLPRLTSLTDDEVAHLTRLRTLSEHQARLIKELTEQLATERELAAI